MVEINTMMWWDLECGFTNSGGGEEKFAFICAPPIVKSDFVPRDSPHFRREYLAAAAAAAAPEPDRRGRRRIARFLVEWFRSPREPNNA